ncbi:IS4 family transposase [Kitasatospora sp. NPDC050463]|uniref:IS4 family transposase n=1 Tax=Kitasatospora sp. NPDC050463 TaxID=3155786 RepID=UPI0033CF03FE
MAEAAFSAGHLGELTRIVSPELVDEVLAETKSVQQRVRLLPSRTVVYFLLAMTLFPESGYLGVWSSLVAGLAGASGDPSATALRHARRRVGSAPLKLLFQHLRGSVSSATTLGVYWRSLHLAALDATTLALADTPANSAHFGRVQGKNGAGGYPLARVSAIVECGTRALIDSAIAPLACGEATHAVGLLRSLRPGMLLLADRAYDTYGLLRATADTGAHALFRARGQRVLPVLHALPDGSWISFIPQPSHAHRLKAWLRRGGAPAQMHGLGVRVIEATITTTDREGASRRSTLRLITTLLDHTRYPAAEVTALYHERWEAETAFFGLKVTLRGADRVLRSGTPHGVDQEIYAYLITYQAARIAMCQAADHADLDPDRLSFTVAVRAIRESVIIANCSPPPLRTVPEEPSRLAFTLLKPRNLHTSKRRQRTSDRAVKRPLSPYAYKSLSANRRKRHTTTTVTITRASDSVLTNAAAA